MRKKNRFKCIICGPTKKPLCCSRYGSIICINCASDVYPEEGKLVHSSYCPFCLAAIAQVNHVKAFLIPKSRFGGLSQECKDINRGWFELLLGNYLRTALAEDRLWINTAGSGLAVVEHLKSLGVHINKFNPADMKCSPAAYGMKGDSEDLKALLERDKKQRIHKRELLAKLENADFPFSSSVSSDTYLEILKHDAKISQLRLEAFYINRKIKSLEQLEAEYGVYQRMGDDLFWRLLYALYLNPNKLSITESYRQAKEKAQKENPGAMIPTVDQVRYQLKKLDREVVILTRNQTAGGKK